MNVFLFELKREWRSAAVWAIVILGLLAVLMAFVFPVYHDSQDALMAALEGFPPEFAAAFGLERGDLFSYGGFYAFCFLYLSLCGAIMAASLGFGVFAREKRSKCTDFLMTKPQSRGKFFAAKLLSALAVLAVLNILFIALSIVLYRASGQDTQPLFHAVLASCALLFTQLFFLAAAVFIAVFARKVRSVSGAAMAVGFGGFILTALYSALGEEALRYTAPLRYFDVSMAFAEGRFETRYAVTAAVIAVLLLGAAFVRYLRSDVRAV